MALRLLAIIGLAILASGPGARADDVDPLVGTWLTSSDEPGSPWGYAEVRVTFAEDGSGVEQATIDGSETSYDFAWRRDPAAPDGIIISLGVGEDYAIPLDIIDRDTIRMASPASADLPEHPMTTFTRLGRISSQASQAPADPTAPIPFTEPVIGMVGEYSNGMVMTVLDIPAPGETVVEERHPTWGVTEIRYAHGIDWLASTWYDDDGVARHATYDFDTALLAQAWPLTPGYQTSYVSVESIESEAPRTLQVSLRVNDPQPYGGPAGTHHAGVVEVDIDLGGGDRVLYAYWYVPDFALPVRIEVTNRFADGTTAQDQAELTGYSYPR